MKSDIDKEILKILEEDDKAASKEISERLGVEESIVLERMGKMTDIRTKVLIVDDEIDTLTPLKRALEVEGYAVIEAMDGVEALEKVKSENPDLVLLDLMLPKMDGNEVCQKLRKNPMTEGIPIIMLTAKGDMKDKIEGIETGADDYVTKPFNLSELKARIKTVLRRAA